MRYDLDSALAHAGSWAEMERVSNDDQYYQGYVSGMAEIIYLIYEEDIDIDDRVDDIEALIKDNVLYIENYCHKDA